MTVIVITGASHGIGQATAEAFASLDNVQIALVSRNTDKLQQVKNRCEALGARATVYACDLTQDIEVQAMGEQVIAELGTPEVLVNNAGGFEPGNLLQTSTTLFKRQINTNTTSAFMVTRVFAEAMIQQQSGTIFYLSSVAALGPYPRGLAYSVAKHAIVGLAHGVRHDLQEHGIRVSCVYPGATLTPTWGDISAMGISAERLMKASDIAQAILSTYQLSEHTVVEDIILRPQLGDL